MPQISKYKLDHNIQKELFQRFWDSVARLKNMHAVSEFFSDFLTDTESVMLAKRLTVAVLLLRGKRAIDISRALNVSFSTVGRVASWVHRAAPTTRGELERISKSTDWDAFIDTIEKLLDTLPPRYHSDLVKAGKEKFEREKTRMSRRSLR